VRFAAVAALLLGAVLVAGCAATLSPSVGPVTIPGGSSPSGSAPAGPCSTVDIKASDGPWGGAAGSRGADVTVTATSTASCLLPPRPVVAIVDATRTVVLQAKPVVATGQRTLGPGRPASFSIIFGNWCDPAPKLPLHPVLVLDSGLVEIGGLALATVDDLPPCNGPGQPATISATDWQPS
jgi:Protein of unknown function (DUF4232)